MQIFVGKNPYPTKGDCHKKEQGDLILVPNEKLCSNLDIEVENIKEMTKRTPPKPVKYIEPYSYDHFL